MILNYIELEIDTIELFPSLIPLSWVKDFFLLHKIYQIVAQNLQRIH